MLTCRFSLALLAVVPGAVLLPGRALPDTATGVISQPPAFSQCSRTGRSNCASRDGAHLVLSALGTDSTPRLTSELVARFDTLEQALKKLPDTAKVNTTKFTVHIKLDPGVGLIVLSGDTGFTIVNWGAVAPTVPQVAAAFTEAHLLPIEYLSLKTAIAHAYLGWYMLSKQYRSDISDTSTTTLKNVVFARAHMNQMLPLSGLDPHDWKWQ